VRKTWFSRRAIGLHVTVAVVVPSFLALAWWQFERASSGNELSWAYTFEWPVFAAYAVFMWWKLVHEWPDNGTRNEEVDHAVAGTVGSNGNGSGREWAKNESELRRFKDAGSTEDLALSGANRALSEEYRAPALSDEDVALALSHEDVALSDEDLPLSDEDLALREYNQYLAALNASGRRKTW